jgi:signal transduction histidine kinase
MPTVSKPGQSTILIVEDDRTNVVLLARILARDDYRVISTTSGEDALEQFARLQPDLVLLDVMLPGIDGLETCRRLKARHGDACPPIIFITARNDSADVIAGFEAGGTDYLRKPFQPEEVAARVRVHLQNRALTEEQKNLVAQLTRSNAAKNRFLGIAAHDLRNPLSSIRGMTEFLRDDATGPLNAEQRELVDHIHDASDGMLALVNELLDLSVIESGELRLVLARTSAVAIVDAAIALNRLNAERKGTRVEFDRTRPLPELTADAAKLRQVLDNLLSNAIKYSPPCSTVMVAVAADGGSLRFAVRDQGPGIPAGERDRLFQDFGRTSVQPTGGEKSTGLGLAICRKIVEAHGGSIAAANVATGGCEFIVALPLSHEIRR